MLSRLRFAKCVKQIPAALVALRFVIAPLLLWDARDGKVLRWFWAVVAVAFLSDIFDGVIARKLKVVTARLRMADSYADILFYCSLMGCIYLARNRVAEALWMPATIVAFAQLLNWGFSLAKFRKLTSYHSYLAKLRGAILFFAAVGVFSFDPSGRLLWASAASALISNTEGIIITAILPVWKYDVWSIAAARRLRALA